MNAQADGRVAGVGVAADHEEEIGLVMHCIGDGVGHCAGAEGDGQTGHRGSVSKSGAVIYVVRPDHRAHEFLHEEVLLIGRSGAGEACHGVWPVRRLDAGQLVGNEAICLVPRGLLQHAVAADQRRGQPLPAVDEVEGEAAFDAERAVVRGQLRLAVHLHDRVAFDLELHLAACAAVGAGGADKAQLLVDHRRQRVLLLQCAGGAVIGAAAAVDAVLLEAERDADRPALLVP